MGQAYVLSNWVDYGLDIQEALDAGRFFLYDGTLEVEDGIPEAARKGLGDKGHRVVAAEDSWGGGQGIVIDWENGVLQGGSDPRKDGHAAGY
jgi:gamma-glutamyltranspeptidase/glutathione hydrolase